MNTFDNNQIEILMFTFLFELLPLFLEVVYNFIKM